MLDVVWTEHRTSPVYFEGETDTFQYQLMFESITEDSLEPKDLQLLSTRIATA